MTSFEQQTKPEKTETPTTDKKDKVVELPITPEVNQDLIKHAIAESSKTQLAALLAGIAAPQLPYNKTLEESDNIKNPEVVHRQQQITASTVQVYGTYNKDRFDIASEQKRMQGNGLVVTVQGQLYLIANRHILVRREGHISTKIETATGMEIEKFFPKDINEYQNADSDVAIYKFKKTRKEGANQPQGFDIRNIRTDKEIVDQVINPQLRETGTVEVTVHSPSGLKTIQTSQLRYGNANGIFLFIPNNISLIQDGDSGSPVSIAGELVGIIAGTINDPKGTIGQGNRALPLVGIVIPSNNAIRGLFTSAGLGSQ